MPQALVTLPDGKKARVTFTDQAQLDATVSDLVTHHSAAPKATPEPKGFDGDPISRGLGETGVQAATGMMSAAAGGVAGVARGVGAGAAALAQGEGAGRALDAFTEEAAGTIEKVSEAGTYQPRTEAGQRTSKIVQAPFTLLQKGADVAGDVTSRGVKGAARALGASDPTATRIGAGAGAVVNTAVQAAPALLAPAAKMVRARMGAGAASELSSSGAPRNPPSDVGGADVSRGAGPSTPGGGAPGAPPQPPLSASGAPRTPPTDIGGGEAPGGPRPGTPGQPPPTPGSPSGAPGTPPGAPAGSTPAGGTPHETRARAYAGSLGLDWTTLGAGVRKALTTIAQDAGALERLNPEAVQRQAVAGSHRVPVRLSAGQATQDPVQLRREAIAARTEAGQPIRDLDADANRDIQANLEILRGRVGGRRGGIHDPTTEAGRAAGPSMREPTKTPTEVGGTAQGAARGKASWSKKGYQALYKVARKTEPDAAVPAKPLEDLLGSNPDIQNLGFLKGWLATAKKVAPKGQAEAQFTLGELHDLRSKAGKVARAGGIEGYHAGEVVEAINTMMDQVPEGAKAWKRANEAFKKHQAEFKDQAAVGKLVNQKKGGADRALALEKTWKTVATGQLEDLRKVKRTLLTGGTPATRMAGRKAWRDLRAETVNRVLEDARNVSATDPTERRILTAVALRRSINRIPRENLEEMLGKANVRELNNILRTRELTRGRTTESGTVPNALVLFEKVLKHIPGGKYAVGAKHAIKQIGAAGEATRAARDAQLTPLEQTAQEVSRISRKRATRAALETLERGGPTLSPGASSQPLPIGDVLRPRP